MKTKIKRLRAISTAPVARSSSWDRDTLAAVRREIAQTIGASWPASRSILSVDQDVKTVKGRKVGFLTGAVFMAAHTKGGIEVCRWRNRCEASCIDETGMGQCPPVKAARLARKRLLDSHPSLFLRLLRLEIASLQRKATAQGLRAAVRLNATSDIPYEEIAPWLFDEAGSVQFYDYTKYPAGDRNTPANYHLTYSWVPSMTPRVMRQYLAQGTLAVPFARLDEADPVALPERFLGHPVVDGDEHDLVFPPFRNVGDVVGLVFKGLAGTRPPWRPGMFAQPITGRATR